MILVHIFIIIILFHISSVLAVIYIIWLISHYVGKANEKKRIQNQENNPNAFRTPPSQSTTNQGVIDVNNTSSPISYSTNQYGYGNNSGYVPDVVKRLKLTGDDKKFVERLWGRRTNFLGIHQCEDETVKLYLYIINSFRDYASSSKCSESAKIYMQKLFTEKPPTYFDYNFYNHGTQSFVNDLYKLCEDAMRRNYRHNRKLDTAYYLKGLSTQVDQATINFIQKKIQEYKPTVTTPETKLKLSLLTPSAWKEELRKIKQDLVEKGFNKEINKNIQEIIDINEYNPQFFELCLETCKVLAGYNKEESLLYYMFYKGQVTAQGKDLQDLPDNVRRIIFNGDLEKYKEFLSISFDLSLSELRTQIKEIFTIKRKKIVINPELVEEKRKLDGEVVSEINKILADEEEIQVSTATNSLDDIFSSPSEKQEKIQFSLVQKTFLSQFISSNYILTNETVDTFSKNNNTFPNMLINEINELFYEVYEDSLITEEGNMYTITEAYRPTIQTL